MGYYTCMDTYSSFVRARRASRRNLNAAYYRSTTVEFPVGDRLIISEVAWAPARDRDRWSVSVFGALETGKWGVAYRVFPTAGEARGWVKTQVAAVRAGMKVDRAVYR
jgi:hypothetical protein